MTFTDGELATLLGAPMQGLLLTCVGVPEYTSATGGRPGEPTAIRTVTVRASDNPMLAPRAED